MSVELLPRWFSVSAIERALDRQDAPDAIELRDILDKSMQLVPLDADEVVALMRVSDPVEHERILAVADEVMTTKMSCPCFTRRLVSSAAL